MKEIVLLFKSVTQICNGVTLLDNFNLHIFKSEIMGMVCVNDHGEDALLNLICKNIPIHYGRIYFNDILVNNYEYSSMSENRVTVIEKQSRLVENLTVADNVFVLRKGFKKHIINTEVMNAQLKIFTDEIGLKIKGNQSVLSLTPFEKCAVELLKAVITGAKIIVIREISNFISASDLADFQKLIKYYADKGFSFLYLCNHHEEAFKICNRISLMKNGKIIKILDEIDFVDEKVYTYVPECLSISRFYNDNDNKSGILKFKGVSTDNIKNLSFTIEKGECVVILDMNNTVLNDIKQLMLGEINCFSDGSIFFDGEPYGRKKAFNSVRYGIDFINESPVQSMLFNEMSYIYNLCFLINEKYSRKSILFSKGIQKSVIHEYGELIGSDIYEKNILELSQESLYKLIYYRIHLHYPKVVFCVQPFSGADLYLRCLIIELINQLKKKGITVIILAVSISDSLLVADRLLIIEQGRLKSEYNSAEFCILSSEGSTFHKLSVK